MTIAELEARLSLNASDLYREGERADKYLTDFAKRKYAAPTIDTAASAAAQLRHQKQTDDAILQLQKMAQARRIAAAEEAESKRRSIEVQGNQQRLNQEAQSNARLEAQQKAHLQRLIHDKERAEQRLAITPRRSMAQRGESNINTGQQISSLGSTLSMGVTAPVVGAAALSLNEGIKWQSDFAGVKKTVNGSPTQLRELELSLRDMAAGSKAIPITTSELAKIAEMAGELGVEGTQNIGNFTRSVADMSATTNAKAETAASSLARLDNIMGTSQKSFDRMGSTIVALGNEGASTETQIMNMGLRLAGQAKQIGLTVDQALGTASALSSVGINPEAGGTAFSTFWKKTDDAVRKSSKELEGIAKVAGVSATQFKKAWQTDAGGATLAFIEGLGRLKASGKSAAGTLDEIGMKGVRLHDTLIRLSSATGSISDLRNSLRISSTAWQENTAMADEAAKRYSTTASQLQILQNRLREVAIKASEAVLPGFNKELKGFSEGIPEMAQKTAAAYEALGPAGQTAAKGVLAVTLAAGPTLKLAGTVMQLVGTYQKVAGAAKAAQAASAAVAVAEGGAGVAAGAGGIAALASNPVGWVIMAAAIVAAIGLVLKFKHDYEVILERTKELEGAARKLNNAFSRSLEGAPNNKVKKQIEELQEQAKGASGNVEKLQKALAKAHDTDARIQKLGLAPNAELPLRQELKDIIESLQSQYKIALQVRAEQAPGGAVLPPGFRRRGRGSIERIPEEDALEARAKVYGIDVPNRPRPLSGGMGTGNQQALAAGRARYAKEYGEWRDKLAEIDKTVSALEKGDAQRRKNYHESRFDTRANAAIRDYGNNLFKLVEVQDAFNKAVRRGYQPDADENRSMGYLNVHVKDLQGKVQADHKKRVDDANTEKAAKEAERKAAAEKAGDAQQKIDESLADQARAETGRGLQDQLGHLQSFGSEVDSVLSGIAQIAEKTGEMTAQTARSKMEASLMRSEYDHIPWVWKNAAIETAGYYAELQKIDAAVSGIRQSFDGIFAGLGREDQAKFATFAAQFEKDLGLAAKGQELLDKTQARAYMLHSGINGAANNLKQKINANQLAGRPGFDDSKNPNDGNLVNVARTLLGQNGSNPQVAGKAFGKEWCVGFLQSIRSEAGLPELAGGTLSVKALRSWAKKSGLLTNDPQAGDVFTIDNGKTRHAALVSKRVGDTVTTIGGNEGAKNNYKSKVKEGATYNINAPGVLFIRHNDASRASKVSKGDLIAEPLPVEESSKQSIKREPTSKYAPKFLTMRPLPAAWGQNMNDYRAQEGESTEYRRAMESVLQSLVNQGINVPLVGLQHAKKEGLRLDLAKSRKDANNHLRDELNKLEAEIRQTVRDNNPYMALQEELKSGALQFADKQLKDKTLTRTIQKMGAEIDAELRDMKAQIKPQMDVYEATKGLLDPSVYDSASFDRGKFTEDLRAQLNNQKLVKDFRSIGRDDKADQFVNDAIAVQSQPFLAAQNETALRQYDDQLKAQRDANSLAQFQLRLVQNTRKSQQEINDELEVETVRRSTLAGLVARAPHFSPEEQAENERKAAEAARNVAGTIAARNKSAALQRLRDITKESTDSWAGLRNNRFITENYGIDDSEVEIKRQVGAKRRELMGRQGADKLPLYKIDQMTKDYDRQLRFAEATRRIEEDKRKVYESQVAILGSAEQLEMRLMFTSRAKLDTELSYAEKRRNIAEQYSIKETAIARLAREQYDAARLADADRQDRLDRIDSQARDVNSMIRGVMEGRNPLDMLKGQMLDQASASLTNRIFGRKLIDDQPAGALDLFLNGRQKPLEDLASIGTDPKTGFTAPFYKNLNAGISEPLKLPSVVDTLPTYMRSGLLPPAPLSVAQQVADALSKGLAVGSVSLTTVRTDVKSGVTNVQGGATPSLSGFNGFGGGAGSSPSLDQLTQQVIANGDRPFGSVG